MKPVKISNMRWAKEEKNSHFSSNIHMLALMFFLSVITAAPFIHGGSAEEKNGAPQESIRSSELSSNAIDKMEVELSKRLVASSIKPFLYKASIQGDEINLLVERIGWKALSLNEKADTLFQVAEIYKDTLRDFVGVSVQLNDVKTEIHFYDRGSNKELAFWSEGSGIIFD